MRTSPIRRTAFPYTTLFRSCLRRTALRLVGEVIRPLHGTLDRFIGRRLHDDFLDGWDGRSGAQDDLVLLGLVRKRTGLNSSHGYKWYAVSALNKKSHPWSRSLER